MNEDGSFEEVSPHSAFSGVASGEGGSKWAEKDMGLFIILSASEMGRCCR